MRLLPKPAKANMRCESQAGRINPLSLRLLQPVQKITTDKMVNFEQ
jgi:hypothetical protein